jgi:phosphotransferase system enzyme I (PtsI)
MTKRIQGLPISGGVGIGKASVIIPKEIIISKGNILRDEVNSELERFDHSIQHALDEIDHLIENYAYTKNNQNILKTHKMILKDPEFLEKVKKLIREDLFNLEKAVDQHFREVIELFSKMDNEYMAERANDFKDVKKRLLSHITNQASDNILEVGSGNIVIMPEITPSEITSVFDKKIAGLITETGSKTAHSSILARSFGIPTVSGLPNISKEIEDDTIVIVDGYKGEIIIDPDAKTLKEYQAIVERDKEEKGKLEKLIDQKVQTLDGKQIKLKCNVEIPEEMPQVQRVNADGIGLMRTEFIFIDKEELPTEEEQFNIYKNIVEKMGDREVTIRTIDVGGDKLSKILNLTKEQNPNLGCRGIRVSLLYPEIFKVQIRAILRANKFGNIALMFPMISSIKELHDSKKIVQECIKELENEKVEFDSNIKIGVMIEIPSAAITSDVFAKECDFFSIGTNDLIQYTLAVDRGNEQVNEYFQPLNPAVLNLINLTIKNSHKNNITSSICGEMASEIKYIEMLIGMGIDELSVSPGLFLAVKNKILSTNYKKAKKIAEQVLQAGNVEKINKIIFS